MCGLKKCCVNCKYYEHIREVDNEADLCHYPDHEGIISNDPEYVKSEVSSCIHYKANRIEQKYDIGDRVRVKAVEGRSSYSEVLGKMGTIKKVIYDDFFGGPSYTYWVKVDNCTNKYQQEGLYVFNKDKSLTLVASTSRERIMKSELETKIMANAIYGKAAIGDPICKEPDILSQYLDKKSSIYTIEREQAIQKINEASPVGKAITNFIAALKKAGLKDEMVPDFQMLWNDNCLTDTEKASIKELNSAYNCAMKNLHDTVRQCDAILRNCQTFEQRMDVLQKYDIIDGNYKLKA